MKIEVNWNKGMHFIGKSSAGHDVNMDAYSAVGGTNQGPTPMELLLMGIGGCSGIDVVSILEKMKVNFQGLSISIQGERAEEHPKVFKQVQVTYHFTGENLPMTKLEKAVKLSLEKYCSVSNNLKGVCDITYAIETNNTNS